MVNDDEAVILAWNLINNFSIPVGVSGGQDAAGKTAYDYTQWQAVYDLTRHRIYFRTYDNQNIRTVSLDKFLDGKKSLFIPMAGVKAIYQDVSGEAK
ncbi:linear amide C-N hydrolase [Solidesulfovibrio sp. C21]|uniref:linear amide C-N hydrolase n=1 Tax=Solidesulfovibrio sp. C21 TaxID=3398613 RepID=UPI0039FC3521